MTCKYLSLHRRRRSATIVRLWIHRSPAATIGQIHHATTTINTIPTGSARYPIRRETPASNGSWLTAVTTNSPPVSRASSNPNTPPTALDSAPTYRATPIGHALRNGATCPPENRRYSLIKIRWPDAPSTNPNGNTSVTVPGDVIIVHGSRPNAVTTSSRRRGFIAGR